MGSNFVELSEHLGVTPQKPSFTLGGKKLFYYFDPPHLIKALRNNMLTNEICWDNKKTSWKYIVQFYEKDKKLRNRLAPKLTESHIKPTNFEKMRVKFATQVLSATVAASLETYVSLKCLPQEASDTVTLISHADKLFDIFNSSSLNNVKLYNRKFSGEIHQIDFLNDSIKISNNMSVMSIAGRNITNHCKFIKGWKIIINSLLEIWAYLKSKNFKFILTRCLNQDCLAEPFSWK